MRSSVVLLVSAAACAIAIACGARPIEDTPAPPQDRDWKHDGYLVVCNQADANAELIDLQTGKSIKKIPTGVGPHEAAISDDGATAVITNYGQQTPGNSLTVAAIPSGKVLKTIDLGTYTRPHGAAWLDKDRVLVTSETTQNVVQVNITEGKVEKAFATAYRGSHMLALDRAGMRVYTANIPDANVTAIDLKAGKKVGEAPAAARSEGLAVSPDGKWIVTGNLSGSVSIIDAEQMKKVKDLDVEGMPYRAAFSPDGKRAFIPCPQSREIVVIDIEKQEIASKISTARDPARADAPLAGPRGVCFNPNGKWAYITLNESGTVAVLDVGQLTIVGRIGVGRSPDGVAYSGRK